MLTNNLFKFVTTLHWIEWCFLYREVHQGWPKYWLLSNRSQKQHSHSPRTNMLLKAKPTTLCTDPRYILPKTNQHYPFLLFSHINLEDFATYVFLGFFLPSCCCLLFQRLQMWHIWIQERLVFAALLQRSTLQAAMATAECLAASRKWPDE